jgi:hypothetical protein
MGCRRYEALKRRTIRKVEQLILSEKGQDYHYDIGDKNHKNNSQHFFHSFSDVDLANSMRSLIYNRAKFSCQGTNLSDSFS